MILKFLKIKKKKNNQELEFFQICIQKILKHVKKTISLAITITAVQVLNKTQILCTLSV
jgi:hypothetical protein